MEKITAKRIVLFVLAFLLAALVLLSLFYPVIVFDANVIMWGEKHSVKAMMAENGFKLLSGDSEIIKSLDLALKEVAQAESEISGEEVAYATLRWVAILSQVFSLLILIVSCLAVLGTVAAFFFDKKYTWMKTAVYVLGGCSVLYFAQGLLFTISNEWAIRGILTKAFEISNPIPEELNIEINAGNLFPYGMIYTFTYLPLIFSALFVLAYFILDRKIPNSKIESAERLKKSESCVHTENTVSRRAEYCAAPQPTENTFLSLQKYKELYDAQILSDEDLSKMKKLRLAAHGASALSYVYSLYCRGVFTLSEYERIRDKIEGKSNAERSVASPTELLQTEEGESL